MGFFSAIKKFFGGKESGSESQQIEETTAYIEEKDLQHPVAETNREAEKIFSDQSENIAENPSEPDKEGIGFALLQNQDTVREEALTENDIQPEPISEDLQEKVHIGEVEPVKPAEAAQSSSELDEYGSMLVQLRQVEPGLTNWLKIVLEGVDKADNLLWERISFLLKSLNAPQNEIDAFMEDFRKWVERMDYTYLEEFRSELQYRLALALELEDEEDERNRLVLKLSQGLKKTREEFGKRLDQLFSNHGELDRKFWEELEELFIMADFGYEASTRMIERLQERAMREKIKEARGARRLLQEELKELFKKPKRIEAVNNPEVILFAGVNGVGKTTTIAKLAYRAKMQGKKPLIVAADTFRAAAIEQLEVWAKRVGSDFYAKKQGSDPASVAWEAIEYALNNNIDVVFVDTAGRLQTKTNLMEELGKIRQVIAKKHNGAPHRNILVLDATTGQNALSQARLFKEAAGINEIILTKLDGTAKGGVAIAVAMQENLPISYIGLGEKMEDLRPFNGEAYADMLFEDEKKPDEK